MANQIPIIATNCGDTPIKPAPASTNTTNVDSRRIQASEQTVPNLAGVDLIYPSQANQVRSMPTTAVLLTCCLGCLVISLSGYLPLSPFWLSPSKFANIPQRRWPYLGWPHLMSRTWAWQSKASASDRRHTPVQADSRSSKHPARLTKIGAWARSVQSAKPTLAIDGALAAKSFLPMNLWARKLLQLPTQPRYG